VEGIVADANTVSAGPNHGSPLSLWKENKMRATRSTAYALPAVGYLARKCGDGLVPAEDISQKYDIPLEYLLKILQQLVRAKVLSSKRGPRGGFSVTKPTNKITMLEVIEAVEGPLTGELNLPKHTKNDKYSAKIQQTYDEALSGVSRALQKAKLSSLLGGK
jgi:Rrf2 family protein